MKFLIVLICIGTCSCVSINSRVGSDYDQMGEFDEYFSYQIGTSTKQMPAVEKALSQRLNSLGYRFSKSSNASFIVHYSIVGKHTTLNTIHQPKISHWLNNRSTAKSLKFHEEKLEGRTLIVSFFDPEIKRVVWRGYLSDDNLTSPEQITSGVFLLMDDFKLVSEKLKQRRLLVSN